LTQNFSVGRKLQPPLACAAYIADAWTQAVPAGQLDPHVVGHRMVLLQEVAQTVAACEAAGSAGAAAGGGLTALASAVPATHAKNSSGKRRRGQASRIAVPAFKPAADAVSIFSVMFHIACKMVHS